METTQQILSLIYDNKEKLTDDVYKELCDMLMKLNKAPVGYVKVTGFMVKAVHNKYGESEVRVVETDEPRDSCLIFHSPKCEILQVVDEIPTQYEGVTQCNGCNLPRKMLCGETYEKMNAVLPDRGYFYLDTSGNEENEKYFVTRMETLK
jgi:hypothetical protein